MSNETLPPPNPPALPTIEVTGNAVRQQAPKSGVIFAPVEGKALTQEAAWEKFQTLVDALYEAVGTAGTIGNVMPRESSEDVSRVLRSGVEYTVAANIEVEFVPANYAQVLEAFLKCGVKISIPRFTYDELPKVTPELLAEAAAAARDNATGIATGVHGRIGRLVAINIGPPRRKAVFRPARDMDSIFSLNLSPSLSRHTSSFASLVEEKLETYDTEIQVTVEYEIIEDSSHREAA